MVSVMTVMTMMTVMTKAVFETFVLFSLLCLLSIFLFVKDGDNESRSAIGFSNLEEGVLVTKIIFTFSAVVKVFANSAFVANAENWVNSTAIALNSSVLNKWFFGLFNIGFRFLHQFIKDARDSLLKLLLNKIFNCFLRTDNSIGFTLLTFSGFFSFFM